MKHPRVAAGVFSRFVTIFILLLVTTALGGCSLFGIATKGNLEDLAQEQDQQHQQLQSQVAASAREMDSRVGQVEDKTRQLDQDLVRYETEIQSARAQLQTIERDLDTFEEGLDRASSDSKQALRIQHDAIISERDRLQRRLEEINALILSWEQQRRIEPEGTVTPVPGGLIIPEKQLETRSRADADQASNKTSVWKDRRSGGN
ncbi:MAG: hypothetical protein ABFS42_15835 [Candidatus Krumholzibacteriota bacterium]